MHTLRTSRLRNGERALTFPGMAAHRSLDLSRSARVCCCWQLPQRARTAGMRSLRLSPTISVNLLGAEGSVAGETAIPAATPQGADSNFLQNIRGDLAHRRGVNCVTIWSIYGTSSKRPPRRLLPIYRRWTFASRQWPCCTSEVGRFWFARSDRAGSSRLRIQQEDGDRKSTRRSWPSGRSWSSAPTSKPARRARVTGACLCSNRHERVRSCVA